MPSVVTTAINRSMITTRLGIGSYATVDSEVMAIKRSSLDEFNPNYTVPVDSIVEVSILRHLNQSYIQDELEYNPFPVHYQSTVSTRDVVIWRENATIASTTTRMSYVGRTIANILEDDGTVVDGILRLEVPNIIRVIERHLDSILECVSIMHANHVIHNDLHVNNLTIDEENKVHIIDFGMSQLGSMKNRYMGTLVPGGNSHPSCDLWKLASSIVAACRGQLIIPDVKWAVEVLSESYSDVDYESVARGDFDRPFPVPDSIPSPLRERLQTMLSVNPRDRNYSVSLNTPPIRELWSCTVNREVQESFENALDTVLGTLQLCDDVLMEGRINGVINCYNVTVAVDTLCRWFCEYRSINDVTPHAKAIFKLSIDYDIEEDEGLQLDLGELGEWFYNLVPYQRKVLEVIDWEVFTYANTLLIGGDYRRLIRAIRSDEMRYRYFSMSSNELMKHLQSL